MSYTTTTTKRHSDVMLRNNNNGEQHNGSSSISPHNRRTVAISNYPEHLNPFYKDDNHKRIRFMKVLPKKLQLSAWDNSSSSSSSNRPRSERRSSFSLDGIKEMWKLRPFRSSNKKPMSTTVTKTSESPPRLRAAAVARNEDAFRDVPFQRNRVRASMSAINSPGSEVNYRTEENFPRNSRYRSTMGAAPVGSPSYSLKQGSSQLSVRSTNPFDDDLDDDMISVSGYSVASMPNRPYRKKRRAPLPPITNATNKTDDDKASTNPRVTDSGKTTDVEIIIAKKATEQIQNIGAEIDALLRRTESRETIPVANKEEKEKVQETTNSEVRETELPATHVEKIEITTEEINPVESKEEPFETSTATITIVTRTTEDDPIRNTTPTVEEEIQEAENIEIKVQEKEEEKIEIKVQEKETRLKERKLENESKNPLRIIESEDEEEPITRTQPLHSDRVEKVIVTSTTTSLPMRNENGSRDPYKDVVTEMEKYDVRFVPLKGEEGSAEAAAGKANGNAKTVKDIIESINKSQSLLKINVEEQQRRTSNGSINTRIRDLERKESECKEMLNEIDLDKKIVTLSDHQQVVEEEIPVVIRDLESHLVHEEQENGVNELFKKCRPTSGGKNHDWNPLPKPKRSSPSTPN